ncbi:MAG: hypothetical protein AB1390_09225 [Nitrospirota bacterium]
MPAAYSDSQDDIERRRVSRTIFVRPIRFFLQPNTKDILTGMVLDISPLGLCMDTNRLLLEGQEIFIEGSLPITSQTAVVRWSKKMNDSFFKIGLELKR